MHVLAKQGSGNKVEHSSIPTDFSASLNIPTISAEIWGELVERSPTIFRREQLTCTSNFCPHTNSHMYTRTCTWLVGVHGLLIPDPDPQKFRLIFRSNKNLIWPTPNYADQKPGPTHKHFAFFETLEAIVTDAITITVHKKSLAIKIFSAN